MTEPERTPGTLYPSLTYRDAPAMIEWLGHAFGFRARLVVPNPDGGVRHSELSLGDAVIMVSSPRPEVGRVAPGPGGHCFGLSLWVADPDAHHARAVAAGVEIVEPLADTPFGARGYMARDPEGLCWFFADYRPGQYWDGTGGDA